MKYNVLALTLASLAAGATLPALADTEKEEVVIEVEVDTPRSDRHRMMWFEHIDGEYQGEGPRPPMPPRPHMRAEFQQMRAEFLQKQFAEFDLNNDGYVSLEEMVEVRERQARESAEKLFSKLDQDGTGMLDENAFKEGMQRMRDERRDVIIERIEIHRDEKGKEHIRHHEERRRHHQERRREHQERTNRGN